LVGCLTAYVARLDMMESMADIQVLPDGRVELKVLPGIALKPREAKKETG